MFCIQLLLSVPQQSDVHLQHLHKSIKTQPEKFVGEWNCQNKIRPTTFIFQFLFSLTYCMICWKSKFETCESSIKLCRDLVNYSLISTCKIKHFAKQFWFPQTLRLTQSKILSDLCWVLNKAVSRCNKTTFSLSEVGRRNNAGDKPDRILSWIDQVKLLDGWYFQYHSPVQY